MRYALGILAGILSGLAFSAASIAQKRAINAIGTGVPLFRNLVKSPLWLAGFAAAFVLGAPLNMAAYMALGPTLPPALSSIGLAALPLMARAFLGERPRPGSYLGAAAVALAVTCIGLTGIAIAPESIDWVDLSFLIRGATAVGCVIAFTAACIGFGLRSRSGGGLVFALAAGAAQALMNAFMAPIAGQLGLLVSGSPGLASLVVAGAASLALAVVNFGAIAVAQLALQKGNAALVIPIQQLPLQIVPLILHATLYRGSFGEGTTRALLALGLILLAAGMFALGKSRNDNGERRKVSGGSAAAGLILCIALVLPASLGSQEIEGAVRIYRYACFDATGRNTSIIEMRVVSSDSGMEIVSTDSTGTRGYARLGERMVQEEVRIESAVRGTVRFRLDESGGYWLVEGGSPGLQSRAGKVCIGDLSLFFILPELIDPGKTGSELRFVLVRPEGGQRAAMRLRAEGIVDALNIGGEKVEAYRISMELADPVGRLFWPFQYNYYYRTGDLRFLQYDGPDESKRKSRIVLAGVD